MKVLPVPTWENQRTEENYINDLKYIKYNNHDLIFEPYEMVQERQNKLSI